MMRDHIALATRVELATIPPYLYAMYSIEDQESESARLVASVVVEEMLHVCLTANLLVAVGGNPDFGPGVVPVYPTMLPHHKPDLALELRRCSAELVEDVFMTIESPMARGAPPEDDSYETLGQFHAALEQAVDDLDRNIDLFAGNRLELQLSDPSFYGPIKFDAAESGGLMLVHDRASADEAFDIIIHQGEELSHDRWADPGHQELTHFYKFQQIADGTSPMGRVLPVPDNPRTADFPDHLQRVSDLFNALYRLVYVAMGDLYSGANDQTSLIDRLYKLMSDGLAPVARYLVRQPISDDQNAAPTFELSGLGEEPWKETAALARAVAADHPDLEPVATTVFVTNR